MGGVAQAALVFGWLALGCGESNGSPRGDSGKTADGGSTELGVVTVIRGDPAISNWFTFTLEGRGLEHEGRIVSVRLGHPDRPPERLGAARARIENGAFSLTFEASNEPDLYKRRIAFIDVDDDGVCALDADLLYASYEFLREDRSVVLAGSVPAPSSDVEFRRNDDAYECDIFNQPWPTK